MIGASIQQARGRRLRRSRRLRRMGAQRQARRPARCLGLSWSSFQTTLTPKPEKFCQRMLRDRTTRDVCSNALSKCLQVPAPAVWKSLNLCSRRRRICSCLALLGLDCALCDCNETSGTSRSVLLLAIAAPLVMWITCTLWLCSGWRLGPDFMRVLQQNTSYMFFVHCSCSSSCVCLSVFVVDPSLFVRFRAVLQVPS